MTAPLTDEMVRILRAVDRGAMVMNPAGRYCIAGEPRPDRRSRELLAKRGLIAWHYTRETGTIWLVTEKGRRALDGWERP